MLRSRFGSTRGKEQGGTLITTITTNKMGRGGQAS
jgi:hypothetical protein